MAQIELKFESFEELVDFSKKILGVADEQAHPVYRESKGTNGAQSAAPIQQTPGSCTACAAGSTCTDNTGTDCSTGTGCLGSSGRTNCRAYLYIG